jgi:hypothetical protein
MWSLISPFLMTTFTVVFSISPLPDVLHRGVDEGILLLLLLCCILLFRLRKFLQSISGVFFLREAWLKGQFSQTTGRIA